MRDNQPKINTKGSTSFHAVALNFIFAIILISSHFLFPYIHEIVFSYFNTLFLLISSILFFYFNALFRTSSILLFSYQSLLFRIVITITLSSLVFVFITFLTSTIEIVQRSEFFKFLGFVFAAQIFIVFISKFLYEKAMPTKKRNLALISSVGEFKNVKLTNILSSNDNNVSIFEIKQMDKLIKHSAKNDIESVYIYLDIEHLNQLDKIFNELCIYAFELFWVLPDSIFHDPKKLSITPIALNPSPVTLDTGQYLVKRAIDVSFSISLLMILSPIFLICCLFIKLVDGGPVIYSQLRHGKNAKPFKMLKFRSMKINSDQVFSPVKNDDERVTSIGRLMRRTSFDEFPQLLNIIKGDMSIVGPRPHVAAETDYFSSQIMGFLRRHQVKPGLTGLAQLRSRGKTNSIVDMEAKLHDDMEYINEWSIFLDVKIMLNTPISMWKNRRSTL
ncbi:exopolysaccharide biosynthesis polyprenyl glycosylphosphotransferase [Gammaproteobacteria bacterium]|nr:exopolysaccharide biosynthesis polyprenyl glycosylphosphotransferase [Gammaproteobacteria bacterium]